MVNTNKVPLRRIEGINNYKTNCITEIPQDIKLELADGVLTLKAGSKVYVPNGVGKFDEVVIENDLINTFVWQGNTSGILYYYSKNGSHSFQFMGKDRLTSGVIEPKCQYPSNMWYDTSTNYIKRTFTTGLEWEEGIISFPIAMITLTYDSSTNKNTILSIDQVFNGFGYIGSTVFALPNVKGLIPNGRNEDGTLNNKEFNNNKVLTYNVSATFLNGIIGIVNNVLEVFDFLDSKPVSGKVTYQEDENFNYASLVKYYKCLAGKVITEKGVVTSFNPKKVFKEVDQNDFPQLFEDNLKQKIKVVSDLPSNPEVGVLYYVKE